ncbi:hypothetical protein, partial [Microbacterium sp. UBA3394]|uniref:hypothetical protein n=1 Tax=Microbacterium sp. UBA3394 TaxID=1946945 RepID=UPI00257991F0
ATARGRFGAGVRFVSSLRSSLNDQERTRCSSLNDQGGTLRASLNDQGGTLRASLNDQATGIGR